MTAVCIVLGQPRAPHSCYGGDVLLELVRPMPTQTLAPRAARLDLSFPLELLADGEELPGHCQNISESGLLASFARAPELWASGDLRLHFGADVFSLPARVARLDGNNVGFSFLFRDERDRDAVRRIVAFAAERTQLVGRPPF